MTDVVVSLHGDAIVPINGDVPVKQTVDMFRGALEAAERGETVAAVLVTVQRNHEVHVDWYSPSTYRHDVAAGVMMLQARTARAMDAVSPDWFTLGDPA